MDSTEPVIQLRDISKCYRIYNNPQDRFKQALRDRFAARQKHPPLYREHWALHGINFDIAPGEAVGILGRNGAGKSTLLQIIAGTMTPTAGELTVSGRVTALLELGSGFNPEFTGRENVFHNAQILGLTQAEAEGKFDDIAAFADIGDYLEQPVKTYSSGMMMRLAFAVQTAVMPRILIVDEALSVGDMFFQAKCMARINALVNDGVTLLFVSHDIGAVRQVCSRAILIENGHLMGNGPVARVSDQYTKAQLEDRNRAAQTRQAAASPPSVESVSGVGMAPPPLSTMAGNDEKSMGFGMEVFRERAASHRAGNGTAEILNVHMLRNDKHAEDFDFGEVATIRIYARFNVALNNVNHGIVIRTLQGSNVVFMDTRLQNQMSQEYLAGHIYCFEWTIRLPLMHGRYSVQVGLAHPPLNPGDDWGFIDTIPMAYIFRMNPRANGAIDGFVALPADLAIIRLSEQATS